MTYNKENLLKMLSTIALYDGIEFYERRNCEIFNSIDNFYDLYNYAYGATKLAIIPITEEKDYVIKIPYTGSYQFEEGYYNSLNYYIPSKDTYWEFYGGEEEERPWDYCANEVKRYKTAEERGFANCFAKTELLGYVNNYPIYIQEKCITFSDCKNKHHHSKEEISKTSKFCNYFGINPSWLTDFRLYYSEKFLLQFINFIQDMNWDDDLRNDNIGYINNRPVLIDYSGFLE